MLKSKLLKTFVVFSGLSVAGAQASILNGSFEQDPGTNPIVMNDSTWVAPDPNIPFADLVGADEGKRWGVFSGLSGWNVVGGAGIEANASGNIAGFNAYDGNYYVEMDTHFDYQNPTNSNTTIYQEVTGLTVGQQYELSFAYASRTTLANDNGVSIFWGDDVADLFDTSVMDVDTDGTALAWRIISLKLTATAEDMLLGFGSFGTEAYDVMYKGNRYYNPESNGKGGMLDAISLNAVDVPEPASLGILALGLLGLGAARRKAK
ncbi:PEP-CTERM sorting domain-containing protein [Bowmanella denitrificans]|uniref:PEP-CTERM sorting domain-containing protein n=1 Tax=Bowmanella denitrificans TaxID=366582 RepID=UPI000C9B7535|nr:PEP-CTERM sorting domain-containing protein [Bowmanella denitrificans]